MIRNAVSVRSPESPCCSLHGFALQSPSISRRIHCEPMETLMRLHGDCAANWNFFNRLKNFCVVNHSTANARRLITNPLRLRWDWPETQEPEKCSICSGVAVKVTKMWVRHDISCSNEIKQNSNQNLLYLRGGNHRHKLFEEYGWFFWISFAAKFSRWRRQWFTLIMSCFFFHKANKVFFRS